MIRFKSTVPGIQSLWLRLLFIAAPILILNNIIRVILTSQERAILERGFLDLFYVFSWGFYHDTLHLVYLLLPFALWIFLVPSRWLTSWANRLFWVLCLFGTFTFISFQVIAEWFFWKEFGTRFNFIAVDYLVYTTEVVGNIKASYPMHWVWTGAFSGGLLSLLGYWVLQRKDALSLRDRIPWGKRLASLGVMLVFAMASFFFLDHRDHSLAHNTSVIELSKNGLYEFFSAYRNNELDYYRFYKTMDDSETHRILRQELNVPTEGRDLASAHPIAREIKAASPEKRMNVVLIAIESLSAGYMNFYGPQRNITPNLDRLATESVIFRQMYATGTRTIRGLEALNLSLPPTPGFSVVRRPNNENLFSIGSLFKKRGYDNKFIYGGFGYFDNMNYFFEHNGFQAIDRTKFSDAEIEFANVWGICDENVFTRTIKEADASFQQEKPFFSFVLTTSNHQPFTYPSGRVTIPSGQSREGAIEYTDYSIGKFFKEAAAKPWFKNTLFVIVADHSADGRGRYDVPLVAYHIPLMFYAPGYLEPRIVETVGSQIDIAPTIAALLNFSYTSKFFGKNLFDLKPEEERILSGTYQKVGLFQDGQLVVLSPKGGMDAYSYVPKTGTMARMDARPESIQKTISYYQTASYLLKNKLYQAE